VKYRVRINDVKYRVRLNLERSPFARGKALFQNKVANLATLGAGVVLCNSTRRGICFS
jgi:hypothetical protein